MLGSCSESQGSSSMTRQAGVGRFGSVGPGAARRDQAQRGFPAVRTDPGRELRGDRERAAFELAQEPGESLAGRLVLGRRKERVGRVLAHEELFDQSRLSDGPTPAYRDRLAATDSAIRPSRSRSQPSSSSLPTNPGRRSFIHGILT